MSLYMLTRSFVAVGTSPAVFFGTGILPYILCFYPARMIMVCIVQNHVLLYFPIVKSIDVIVARSILEVITAFWVIAIFCLVLIVFRVDILPIYPEEALLAVFATLYLGVAIGFVGAIMYKLLKAWQAIQILTLIAMYFFSGALAPPTIFPEQVQYYMSFNPLLHAVEWLRAAYYDGYSYGLLDRQYLVGVSTALLLLGLAAERAVRGAILEA